MMSKSIVYAYTAAPNSEDIKATRSLVAEHREAIALARDNASSTAPDSVVIVYSYDAGQVCQALVDNPDVVSIASGKVVVFSISRKRAAAYFRPTSFRPILRLPVMPTDIPVIVLEPPEPALTFVSRRGDL